MDIIPTIALNCIIYITVRLISVTFLTASYTVHYGLGTMKSRFVRRHQPNQ